MTAKGIILAVSSVVPHEGTWIEIFSPRVVRVPDKVVPHEGTWIEITDELKTRPLLQSRSPRGNVD